MSSTNVHSRLLEQILAELRQVSNDTKRKQPHIKEAAETASQLIRQYLSSTGSDSDCSTVDSISQLSGDIMRPLVMACIETTKQPLKLIQTCLTAIHRLVQYDVCDHASLISVADVLIKLGHQQMEELRLIQTALLIVNESNVLTGVKLSQIICLAMNMCKSKDQTLANTANAAVKQMTVAVFECLYTTGNDPTDACSLLKDLCNLAQNPPATLEWLQSLKTFPQAHSIDLINIIVKKYPACFIKHENLMKIARDRILACVVDNIQLTNSNDGETFSQSNRFPVMARTASLFLNLVTRLAGHLTTECANVTELLSKCIEPECVQWQRAVGIETLHLLFYYHRTLPVLFLNNNDYGGSVLKGVVERISSFMHSLTMKKNVDSGLTDSSLVQDILASGKNGERKQQQHTWTQVPQPPSFLYSGNSFVLLREFDPQTKRSVILESWDRELPSIDENHLLTECYCCLQQLCYSLVLLHSDDKQPKLASALAENVWTGILSSFQFLLEISASSKIVDDLLKSYDQFIRLCSPGSRSRIELLIYSLCRLCLPSGYFLTCLSLSVSPRATNDAATFISKSGGHSQTGIKIRLCRLCNTCHDAPCKNPSETDIAFDALQPIVTGMALTDYPMPTVELTYRHLSCLCVLARMCSDSVAEFTDFNMWHQILTVLYHAFWILGISPDKKNGAKLICEQPFEKAIKLIDDIINSINNVLKNTSLLDDAQFERLLMVLLQQSTQEANLGLHAKRHCSLFPIYCVVGASQNNLERRAIWWNLVRDQLLQLATDSLELGTCVRTKDDQTFVGCSTRREVVEFHVNILCSLIIRCMATTDDVYETLSPMSRLVETNDRLGNPPSSASYKCQVETHLHILKTYPSRLDASWPLIIDAIDKCARGTDEAETNRLAFSCFEFMIKDLLPTGIFTSSKASNHLSLLIDALSNFSVPPLQSEEKLQIIAINTTLTAIEMLWQIGDYVASSNVGNGNIWLQLYARLSDPLALDARSSVRKSAIHTLFASCSVHQTAHWTCEFRSSLIYDILFPLVNQTNHIFLLQFNNLTQGQESLNASSETISTGITIVSPTENYEFKTWSETVVGALQGTIGLISDFSSYHNEENCTYRYVDVWQNSLKLMQSMILSPSHDIRMASVECLSQLLSIKTEIPCEYWHIMWSYYKKYGFEIIAMASKRISDENDQAFYTQYLRLFFSISQRIWYHFDRSHMNTFANISRELLLVDTYPSTGSITMNLELQNECVKSCAFLKDKIFKEPLHRQRELITSLIDSCLELCALCMPIRPAGLYKFGEEMIQFVSDLYIKSYADPILSGENILLKIIKAMNVPLSQRMACPSSSTWKLGLKCLNACILAGFDTVELDDKVLWEHICDTFTKFLFPYPQMSSMVDPEYVCYDCIAVDAIELILRKIHDGPDHYCTLASNLLSIIVRGSDFKVVADQSEAVPTTITETEVTKRLHFAHKCFKLLSMCGTGESLRSNGTPGARDEELVKREPTMLQRLAAPMLVERCRSTTISFNKGGEYLDI
ncbi:hypothetical protein ACOME3_008995 [Neoechinorhynchus agilis]